MLHQSLKKISNETSTFAAPADTTRRIKKTNRETNKTQYIKWKRTTLMAKKQTQYNFQFRNKSQSKSEAAVIGMGVGQVPSARSTRCIAGKSRVGSLKYRQEVLVNSALYSRPRSPLSIPLYAIKKRGWLKKSVS